MNYEVSSLFPLYLDEQTVSGGGWGVVISIMLQLEGWQLNKCQNIKKKVEY